MLEQLTHPCCVCCAYFKVSNILYYVSLSYSIYVTKRSIVCNGCSEIDSYYAKLIYTPVKHVKGGIIHGTRTVIAVI